MIFSSEEGAREFLRRSEAVRSLPRVFVTCAQAALACAEAGIPFTPIEQFHRFEDIERINALAHHLSRSWWRSRGLVEACPPLVEFHGVHLGDLVELSLYHVLSEAARALLIGRRLIDSEEPVRISAFGVQRPAGGLWIGFRLDLKALALQLLASERGIPFEEHRGHQHRSLIGHAAGMVRGGARLFRHFAGRQQRALRTPAERSPLPPVGRYHVLAYAEGRHADTLIPLFRAMHEDMDLALTVLTQDASKTSLDALRRMGVRLSDPEAFLNGRMQREVEEAASALSKCWPVIDRLPELLHAGQEEFGVSLWPLVEFQFHWLFKRGFADLLRRIRVAGATLDRLRPDLLLSPVDSSAYDRCWILSARARGIPSLTTLHGAVYVQPTGSLWGTVCADRLAVWGPITRAWHVKATGLPEDHFSCVGYPLFDSFMSRYEILEPHAIRRELGLDKGGPVILFLVSMAGGAVGSYYRSAWEVYDAFFRGVSIIPEAQVIVRTHPASDPRAASACARRYTSRCLVNPPTDLLTLLRVADVVVGQPTTALLEAMLAGKPVVLFEVLMAKSLSWWLEYSELAVVDDPLHLAGVVQKLIADPSKRREVLDEQARFLDSFVGPRDGGSAGRTIRLVKDMIRDLRPGGIVRTQGDQR